MSRTRTILVSALTLTVLALASTAPVARSTPAVPTLRPDVSSVRPATSHHSAPHFVDSVAYVANHLVRNGGRRAESVRVARAVLRYAHQRHLPVRLVLGVIAIEDNLLNPTARSHAGAQGVMQVMPLHVGRLDRCGTDLTVAEVNVCYGTRILRSALDDTGDVRTALLRYNGCVRTRGCDRYAADVLHMARLSEHEMRQATGRGRALAVPAAVRDDVVAVHAVRSGASGRAALLLSPGALEIVGA